LYAITLKSSLYLTFKHYRTLVRNIGGKPKYWGGQGVATTDQIKDVSKILWGTCSGCPPKSMPIPQHIFVLGS